MQTPDYELRIWNWTVEPTGPLRWPPSQKRRLVICDPDFLIAASADACNARIRLAREGATFVMSERWKPGDRLEARSIPALRVERQNDLALVSLLRRTRPKIGRRALVVTPQEEISLDALFGLRPGNTWLSCCCDEIDPSDRPCLTCEGRAALGEKSGIDLVVIRSDVASSSRSLPVPWALSLVEQCRAARVPVAATWEGEPFAPPPILDPIPWLEATAQIVHRPLKNFSSHR